ncbi:MAG TPA: hypothetical protein VM053_01510 [Gemmatimonadaceae bacterium]|nr:hypothetical protein [Gemmatimonadaceae bacterium]
MASRQASGQLRPLEQIPWRVFEGANAITAEVGTSRLFDQRASLAGTSGTLTEIPNFSVAWRSGRVAIEAAGTGQRIFHEDSRFTAAYPDVEPAPDGKRNDSGDYRISTSVRLTPNTYPVTGVLRFGARLPTTDNTTGLDRDATDFFATVGASGNRGTLNVAAEGGLGIYGTRETRFEQDDLFLYSIRAELRFASFIPTLAVMGQQHGYAHKAIRGVENLSEARAGIRFGNQLWLRVEGVKGLTTFSPSGGILVTAGLVR